MNIEKLKDRLEAAGQSHVLQFWDELTDIERSELVADVEDLDLEKLQKCFKECSSELNGKITKVDSRLEPLPASACGSFLSSVPDTLAHYETLGLEAIGRGEVAMLLLAGGQGTRLNVAYPKGMYNVGLPSGRSLYQIQAERIKKMEQLAAERFGPNERTRILWYIMTSEHTKVATESFFQKHEYFGLDPSNIVVFEQYTLPALFTDGKIILAKKHRLANSPDGNGGVYRALYARGVLSHMQKNGVRYVHAYCVDNILVRLADPHFIGFCIERNLEVGAKVVEKVNPSEAVGVVGMLDGHYQVVEYSEITAETAAMRDPADSARLLFRAGNICNHFFTVDFLLQVAREYQHLLKHHIAKKKVPFVDETGQLIEPTKPNAIKLEKFIFDIFQFSKRFAVWEVDREEEFAPLKNADAPGASDCASTCRRALFAQHLRWLLKSGASVELPAEAETEAEAEAKAETVDHLANGHTCNGFTNGKNGAHSADGDAPLILCKTSSPALLRKLSDRIVCEIAPSVSVFGENLENLVAGRVFVSPILLS